MEKAKKFKNKSQFGDWESEFNPIEYLQANSRGYYEDERGNGYFRVPDERRNLDVVDTRLPESIKKIMLDKGITNISQILGIRAPFDKNTNYVVNYYLRTGKIL